MGPAFLLKHVRAARRARVSIAVATAGVVALTVSLIVIPSAANAATNPPLGQAGTFGVLSSTYTNTAIGTTIVGDLGYTTGPAVAPTVNGKVHTADSTYAQAGIDQGSALASLNSQPCTFTFPAGAVDLATDTTHGAIGVYAPGVYCTAASSAASIGTAGITLTGSGTYIFRVQGALTSVANSAVRFASGASACDIWWTPIAATTLGANSTFLGTDIDASGITIGSTITWSGRALAFGGTVSTTTDTITAPTCSTPTTSTVTATTSAAAARTTSTTSATSAVTTATTPPKTSPSVGAPSTTTTVPSAPASPIVPGRVPVTG